MKNETKDENLGDKLIARRQFTVALAMAILSGVAITITAGCGGGGSSASSSPTSAGDKVGAISSNHGHIAVITGAQLTAGGALALDIRGSASHPHTVALSAADIASIAGNHRVAKVSSTDRSHDHTVTFN